MLSECLHYHIPQPIPRLPPDLLSFLAEIADGDARQALNGLELALKACETLQQTHSVGDDVLDGVDQSKRDAELMDAVRRGLRKGYDRSGEERYDMISALHKCLRGSDGSAAMYWLARMITGGEDALYIARRLVVVASEDVGLADNHALPLVYIRVINLSSSSLGNGDVSSLSGHRASRVPDQSSCDFNLSFNEILRRLLPSVVALCRLPCRSAQVDQVLHCL